MTPTRPKFKLVRIIIKGFKDGIANCQKSIQDEHLVNYALKEVREKKDIYNKDYFAIPTIENTSVLRDYVHHKLTKEHEHLEKAKSINDRKPSLLQVLKWLEDKRYRVQCGELARILFSIYRGLGYNATLSDWVDIEPSYYTDSHVLVEVYIPELGKYTIQDPSYNIIVTYNNKPINTLELMSLMRTEKVLENKELSFVNNQEGEEGVFIPVKELSYDDYMRYFGQLYSWVSGSNRMYPAVDPHKVKKGERHE